MSEISKDRLERVITASALSWTGKYRLILAEHITHGTFCYDVLGLNLVSGEVMCRHYRSINSESDKASALAYFDELREKLQRPKQGEKDEPQDPLQEIKPYVN